MHSKSGEGAFSKDRKRRIRKGLGEDKGGEGGKELRKWVDEIRMRQSITKKRCWEFGNYESFLKGGRPVGEKIYSLFQGGSTDNYQNKPATIANSNPRGGAGRNIRGGVTTLLQKNINVQFSIKNSFWCGGTEKQKKFRKGGSHPRVQDPACKPSRHGGDCGSQGEAELKQEGRESPGGGRLHFPKK